MSIIIPGVSADGSVVTAQLADNSITDAKIDFGTGANQVSTADIPEQTNLYYTDERVDDRVNALLTAGANITLTYDDAANTLTIAATEDNLSNNDTDDLSEGSSNLYFTNARASTAVLTTGHSGNITLGSNGNVQFESGNISSDTGEYIYLKSRDNFFGLDSAYLFLDTDSNAVKLSVAGSGSPDKLQIANNVEVKDYITAGDFDYRGNTARPAYGLEIVSPDDKVRWSVVSLEEYGGDLSGDDDKPFNIHNPIFSGLIHGGSPASPTAVGSGQRMLSMMGAARFGTGTNDETINTRVSFLTAEAQSSTAQGSKIEARVTPTGTTSSQSALDISATGSTNLNIAYDAGSALTTTVLSTGSTNGFQVDDPLVMNAQIFRAGSLSGDPGSGNVAGDMYFNTTSNKFRGYNGTDWVDLS